MAFDRLIGNENVKKLLTNSIQSKNVLHSYLFVGIEGIGKSLFAKEFAQAILCSSNKEQPCKACKSCLEFQGESHPDFLVIEPEDGKSIKIEQIRYLQEKIAEKPVTSNKKVYIIKECDMMTREAANSLLKTLEEPPIYATIILITDNESKLLATIKSRCTKIVFNSLSEEDIKKYFQNNYSDKEFNLTNNIIKQCQGSIGKLLKIQEEQESYDQVEKIIDSLKSENITYIWKNADVLYQAKEKILDLLDYMNIIFYNKITLEKDVNCIKAVNIIEEAKKRITANSNYDMTIDNLLLKLWEVFA